MSDRVARRNTGAYRWLSAGAYALLTFAALAGLKFQPTWGATLLALVAGVGALVSSELGSVIAVIALSIPLIAAAPLLGILFLLVGLAATQFLAHGYGRAFVVIALSIAGAAFGPLWAAAVIAGILLGVSEGAILAIVAAVVVEVCGIALGREFFGAMLSGAAGLHVLNLTKMPQNVFALGWLVTALKSIGTDDAKRLGTAITSVKYPVVLVLQPVVWGLGAAVSAEVRRRTRSLGNLGASAVAAAVGVIVLAGLSALAVAVAGATMKGGVVLTAGLSSLIVAVGVAALWEWAFPLTIEERPAAGAPKAAPRPGVATDDADVDELLNLIATAEEKLTTEHTTQKVVMITDMKSFSAMTEQDGSVLTAKAIQKHRELLLPVIERLHGCGKSTGGDGLVAAFDVRSDALAAAAEMQRTLAAYNSGHPSERDLLVRIGVAQGEVVLDKHGRPFIGAGLNLAARVMNLADGGQAFATAIVASAAPEAGVEIASLGDFELKNISKPVEVVEILWAEGQEPRAPAR